MKSGYGNTARNISFNHCFFPSFTVLTFLFSKTRFRRLRLRHPMPLHFIEQQKIEPVIGDFRADISHELFWIDFSLLFFNLYKALPNQSKIIS